MLAICEDRVALVRTYRYPLASWEWAVPRGFAQGDDAGESARVELAEELGQEPDDLIPIGTVTPNSGLLAGRVEIFIARYNIAASEPLDHREVVDVKWIDMQTLYGEIASSRITDSFTLSAVACAQAQISSRSLGDTFGSMSELFTCAQDGDLPAAHFKLS